MNITPYISDILAQPQSLRNVLASYPYDVIEQVKQRLEHGQFDRVVITGMGSSYNSAYPAWLNMLSGKVPCLHINTAELLHYGIDTLNKRTLLWMNSQSGRSGEIVHLLDSIRNNRPGMILSMTNDLESPLGKQADLVVPIHAGPESTVSSKTYINTLACMLLASTQLMGGDWKGLLEKMQKAADAIQVYLADWQGKVSELDKLLDEGGQIMMVGRGQSMGAVWNGSLVIKEASKCLVEGMNAADFRHGPLELTSPQLTLLVLEGHTRTTRLNYDLALDVVKLGGKVIWLGPKPAAEFKTFPIPSVDEAVLPLVEILPIQMLSILLAQRKGLEPGVFKNIGKVTDVE